MTTGDCAARRAPSLVRVQENQQRQRELYGEPIGDRVRRVLATLSISQARLADTLRMSPAMLSQLVSGRRVKIGDPAVLARLLLLDRRSRRLAGLDRTAVDELLGEIRRIRPQLSTSEDSELLWAAGGAAGLAAAAETLRPGFPALAELLSQTAGTG